MADPDTNGQAALRLLARAHRALVDDGHVSTDGLLPSWRALQPTLHAGAARDVIDVDYIVRAVERLGPACLRATRYVLHRAHPRSTIRTSVFDEQNAILHLSVPPGLTPCGDVLALTLGLSLEAAKARHGLAAPPDALRAHFSSPQQARAALDALAAGGSSRTVEFVETVEKVAASGTTPQVQEHNAAASVLDVDTITELARDRPVYVVAGVGAHRMHDLLAPCARRLRGELNPLGKALGGARDEEVYVALDLLSADNAIHDERTTCEVADGFLPVGMGAIAVRCEAMPDSEVDRRCREAVIQLKRTRALLLLVPPDVDALDSVLAATGAECRAVAILEHATHPATPAYLEDVATTHTLALDNALGGEGSLLAVPSPSFFADELTATTSATFALASAAFRARARHGAARTRLAVRTVSPMNAQAMSSACLDTLGRLGPATARQRRG